MVYSEGESMELQDEKERDATGTYEEEYLREIQEVLADPTKAAEFAKKLAAEKNLLEVFKHSRSRDHLTGLYDRKGTNDEFTIITEQLRRRLRTPESTLPTVGSLLLADIENLKHLNDLNGHMFGDEVLKATAVILSQSVFHGDIVCRWGGDEFEIILPECNLDNAKGVAERLRKSTLKGIQNLFGFPQSISIGVSEIGQNITATQLESSEFMEQLFTNAFEDADQAMYFAKQSGGNMTGFKDKHGKLGVLVQDSHNPQKMIAKYQDPSYPGK